MGPPPECISCGGPAKSTAKQVTEISAISGRNLRDIMTSHFWQDTGLVEAMNRKSASLCRDCHALIEQMDAFEQSLLKTKESFEVRRKGLGGINGAAAASSRQGGTTSRNSRIKREGSDGAGINSELLVLKQEPDDWAGQNDFEWDDMENPNNFLDATLQEMDTSGKNGSSFIDDDSAGDDDVDADEDSRSGRVTRRGRRSAAARRRISVTTVAAPTTELNYQEMCIARPERRLLCQDRAAVGADWFSEQRLQFQVLLSDLEADVEYLKNKMPSKLTSAEESHEWCIAMLKAETEVLECRLPGELTCFYCNKDFDSVVKRLEHVVESHCGHERQFICSMCPHYDDVNENTMFTHVSENHMHMIASDVNEKARYGPREPVLNETDKTFACRLCPVLSRSVLAYWHHWYARHKKFRGRQCDICGKSAALLPTAADFRSHFLTEHCNYVYECPDCDVVMTNSETFTDHVKTHDPKDLEDEPLLSAAGRVGRGNGSHGQGRKRNYPAERKPRTKRNALAVKTETDSLLEDDSAADPLTPISRVQASPDICLEPPGNDDNHQHLVDLLSPEIWQDFVSGLSLLKAMPSKVDSEATSVEWDVNLLKLESPKQIVGIPGDRKCFKCLESFSNITDKQVHIVTSHVTDPYMCAICQQTFSKEASAVTHMIKTHGGLWKNDALLKAPENYIICEICGLTCATSLAYWHHKYQSHKRYKGINCPLCDASCNNFILFLRHALLKHANYKYKCFLCEKTTRSVETFKDHLKQHEKGKVKIEAADVDDEEEDFEREEIEINGKKILRKTIGKKGKKPPVECEICGTISKGVFNNARHLYTMHGIKREVQCDKCDTLCESVRAMLEHKKNHHSSASCHLCGKVFVEKGHLENHLMRHGIGKDGKNHQNERDFMCEICSKTFTRKNYLVIHMKNHAEKSIKCTVCSKMFRWNSALQAHLTAAHGMGPKEGACTCEFCGRQFQDKSNYRQHRYTHLQVKPFNCDGCGKGFIRRDLMKSHKEKCHVAVAASAATFNMA